MILMRQSIEHFKGALASLKCRLKLPPCHRVITKGTCKSRLAKKTRYQTHNSGSSTPIPLALPTLRFGIKTMGPSTSLCFPRIGWRCCSYLLRRFLGRCGTYTFTARFALLLRGLV